MKKIEAGSKVRVCDTHDPNFGLIGAVHSVYAANVNYERRAFVEFALTDGPHRRYYPTKSLEVVS